MKSELDNWVVAKIEKVLESLNRIILDKDEKIELVLSAVLARGHILLEDQPGVGKTTLAHTLAKVLGLEFTRVQFTNDFLPADLLGASLFNRETHGFDFLPGPIFTEFLMADELNRASPKTQSALLQAMEEGVVDIDGSGRELPEVFIVVGTQNPMESIGTYPLPESQLDRFLIRTSLGLPSESAERDLLKGHKGRVDLPNIEPVLGPAELIKLQAMCEDIHVEENVLDYVQTILRMVRGGGFQLSTRAALSLLAAARGHAMVQKRHFVVPEDLMKVCKAVFAHRLQYQGGNSEEKLAKILEKVEIPGYRSVS